VVSTEGLAALAVPNAGWTSEPTSLAEIAERLAIPTPAPPPTPVVVAPAPAAAPVPAASPDVQARLADAEYRRDKAEAELRREQDKKQEIKQAVLLEMARLEAQLAEAKERIHRKDEEHAASLEVLAKMKETREAEWGAERQGLVDQLTEKERARVAAEAGAEPHRKALEEAGAKHQKALEDAAEKQRKATSDVEAALQAARAETAKLRGDLEAANAEQAQLRKKLSIADAKMKSLKDATAQQGDLKKQLEESVAKAAGFQADVGKRDQRIKELQMLVKTLGERLNDLADRPRR
jgi:chromosome segregation ATPase